VGFVEIMAARFFKAPDLFAALFAILIAGFTLDRILRLIRARVLTWLEAPVGVTGHGAFE
jgi:ABC-type nitrate/sulfonate/bicarbonate transport system permease component